MLNRFVSYLIVLISLSACTDEVVYVDDLSADFMVERDIAMPLIDATLVLDDFVTGEADSSYFMGNDTILIYNPNDFRYEDTISFEFEEDMVEGLTIDFLALHHTIESMFPVGFDAQIILYDSVNRESIDIVYFSGDSTRLFIKPAPVNGEGIVIEDQVQAYSDSLMLDEAFFDDLLNLATHVILVAEVPATAGLIRVIKHYNVKIKLGLEGSGRYISTEDEN